MANRFDLEQDIMKAWNVVDDIRLLTEWMLDGPTRMTEDQITNVLIGMEHLYEMKFNKLFNTFEKCIKEGNI